jgi:hypothetical protein
VKPSRVFRCEWYDYSMDRTADVDRTADGVGWWLGSSARGQERQEAIAAVLVAHRISQTRAGRVWGGKMEKRCGLESCLGGPVERAYWWTGYGVRKRNDTMVLGLLSAKLAGR